jgi:hypothetical protein
MPNAWSPRVTFQVREPWRGLHAEHEPGDAEPPDQYFVRGERPAEGHDHETDVLPEDRRVPADDSPHRRHDDRLMQDVEGGSTASFACRAAMIAARLPRRAIGDPAESRGADAGITTPSRRGSASLRPLHERGHEVRAEPVWSVVVGRLLPSASQMARWSFERHPGYPTTTLPCMEGWIEQW